MPSFFRFVSEDIGIDLGTSRTIVSDKEGSILVNEPSVVAIDINTYEVLAVGLEAKRMVGKTPDNILAVSPLENGVIADFETTRAMITYFIQKASKGFALFQPRVLVTVPSGLTDVERRSVEDVALYAGARDVILIEENIASAIGLGIDISQPKGHLIVNVGAGTIEVSVVSLNGIVASHSQKIGGEFIDNQIQYILKKKHNLVIGISSAEDIKKKIGTIEKFRQSDEMEISGRDLVTGMPKIIKIKNQDILGAITPVVVDIVSSIRTVLEKTPPEISGDIAREGIYLLGGLSRIGGLSTYISSQLNMPVIKVEHPQNIAGIGAGKACKFFKKIKNSKRF